MSRLTYQLQCALNFLGYSAGREDGAAGPATHAAKQAASQENAEYQGKNEQQLLTTMQRHIVPELRHEIGGLRDVTPLKIMKIERGLNALGIDAGPVNGQLDHATVQAIEKFEHKFGIETATGRMPDVIQRARTTLNETRNSVTGAVLGRARLTVQETAEVQSAAGNAMSKGELVLTLPDGSQQRFQYYSGGFGRYGDDSKLAGLDRDLNGQNNGTNASYRLDYGSIVVDSADLPQAMRDPVTNTGSWIRLGSDRAQTARGGVLGVSDSGFFGIHTDDKYPGAEGCICLKHSDMQRFLSALMQIPQSQRPRNLEVLAPRHGRHADGGQEIPVEHTSETAELTPAVTPMNKHAGRSLG